MKLNQVSPINEAKETIKGSEIQFIEKGKVIQRQTPQEFMVMMNKLIGSGGNKPRFMKDYIAAYNKKQIELKSGMSAKSVTIKG